MSKNFVLYWKLYQHMEHLWWPADFIEETRAKMSLRLSRFRIQNNLCSYLIFIMNFALYTTNLLMKGMLVIQAL